MSRNGHTELKRGGSENWLFPRGVTVWHFVIIPPVVMGGVLLLFRWISRSYLDPAILSESSLYSAVRIILISFVMSLVIAWLAFRHKREYEEQIAAQNKLLMEKDRMAALGQMAAAVAHEVKNPLAGIRGACEILIRGGPGDDPRTEMGEEMLYQVDRLNRSAQNLLMFARPKEGRPVPTQLHLIADRVLKNLWGDPKNRNIEAVRDYDLEAGQVLVDPEQMEQVLLNIMLNAFQAMDRKGTITITTRGGDRSVELTVRDTGPGIPEDLIPRIFEPFFTTRAKGTGLGLAIVRKIIHDHGGTITAAAPEDGSTGTEFRIRLALET